MKNPALMNAPQLAQITSPVTSIVNDISPANSRTISSVSALHLHHEFVRLGSLRLKMKNKMLAILPQIYESGIWKKYAGSIVEYAGKFGDIAKTTVIKRLRLEENLSDKPCLKAAIATVGIHKVALVAKITTCDTDESMAEKLLNMSKTAVQSLSKELRVGSSARAIHSPALQLCFDDPTLMSSSVTQLLDIDPACTRSAEFESHNCADTESAPCKAIPVIKRLELDAHDSFIFLKLKAKLGKNLSDKEFIKLILEEREKQEFPEKQEKIIKEEFGKNRVKVSPVIIPSKKHQHFENTYTSKSVTGDTSQSENPAKIQESTTPTDQKSLADDKSQFKNSAKIRESATPTDQKSLTGETFPENSPTMNRQSEQSQNSSTSPEPRYVTAAKKRQVIASTNSKCSYTGCNSPYSVLHHTDRYSESKSHDSIIPLCEVHHEFAHNNLIKNEKSPVSHWQISIIKPPISQIPRADILYRKYRQEAIG